MSEEEINQINERLDETFYELIHQLQQENTKLKKELEITTFNFRSLSSACGSLAEFMGLDKDTIIEEMIDKVVKDRKENTQLKKENEILKNGTYFYVTPRGYGKTLGQENFRLKSTLKELRKEIRALQEKYFKMCVPGSNNDMINLMKIIDKGLEDK